MGETAFFWPGLEPLLRIIIVGTLAYISIVFIIKISGKRTLANMNSFDFIITVAIGASYGSVLTAKDVTVAEAVVIFFILAFLQFIFSYFEIRSTSFRNLVTSQPKILYYKSGFIKKNLRKERLDIKDVLGSIRKKDFGSLEEVEAVILEVDGTVSVIGKSVVNDKSTYYNLLENK